MPVIRHQFADLCVGMFAEDWVSLLWPLLCLHLDVRGVLALDNGLARTPPMGWLAWER